MDNKRISKDEYFMKIAHIVARRSTCIRRNVGAVLVKDGFIVSTGYNGSISGFEHCSKEICIREKLKIPSGEKPELCRGLHAEQNCIIQAAINGTSISGGKLEIYCTLFPCILCLKILLNSKIDRIIYSEGYYMDNEMKKEILGDLKITITKVQLRE